MILCLYQQEVYFYVPLDFRRGIVTGVFIKDGFKISFNLKHCKGVWYSSKKLVIQQMISLNCELNLVGRKWYTPSEKCLALVASHHLNIIVISHFVSLSVTLSLLSALDDETINQTQF